MSRALPPVSNEVEALVVFVDFVHQKYWFLEFERCLEFKLNVFPGETSGAEEEQKYAASLDTLPHALLSQVCRWWSGGDGTAKCKDTSSKLIDLDTSVPHESTHLCCLANF